MTETKLLVQGWRGISHSYAMVNQYQLLELRRRPGIALFHQDLPFAYPQWSTALHGGGFGAADAGAIAAIPPPSAIPGGVADIAYRIAYPYRAQGGPEAKIFCQATCEYRRIVDAAPFLAAGSGPEIDPRVQFITPSRWSKAGLIASGLAAEQIHVVPHGVDPAIFHPPTPEMRATMRGRLKLAPDRFVFLNVGAMTFNKGIDILLLAFAEVRRRHPHAFLLLKDQRGLYGLSASAVVEQARREHPGRLDDLDRTAVGVFGANLDLAGLRALYGAADAYVSPYRAEAFNLTPLEAAACGIPVAVTAGGATDDYVDDSFALPIAGRDGSRGGMDFLEPELESVIEAMLMLIERRAPRIDPQAAVRWIGDNLTWKHAVDKLLAAFGV